MFKSCFRGLVEVKIQVEQTDQKMGILLQILGYRFAAVTLDELDFGDVAKRAIPIVNRGEVVQLFNNLCGGVERPLVKIFGSPG